MFHLRPTRFVCITLSLLLVVCFANISMAKTIMMKYSDHDPPGGMRTKFLKDVWLPEIEKQTGGQVKIQSFFGGALLNSKEVLKGIGDNMTQAGFLYPGHYPGQLPSFTIYKLFPMGPSKFETMAWLYRKVIEEIPEFGQELKRANQKVLLFTAGLPGAFTGKKPIPNLPAIKGQKWRAGDKWGLRFLENSGAVPVSVPWGDVYMALQTGTIDGCFTNYDGLHMMKFDEVAPNLLISKKLWYAMPFIHNVNLDFWNGLPKDVQQSILKACENAEKEFAKVYEAAFDKVKSEQEASGFKVTVMSDADIAQWASADKLDALQKEWVKEGEAAGLKNAASVLEKMKALHKQAMARE